MVNNGRSPKSRTIFWKAALGIGVGMTCAAAAIIIDANRAGQPIDNTPVADIARPLEATGTASAGGTTLTTASLVLPAVVETPPPAISLPPDKPKLAPAKARETASAKASGFQSCLPSCESRDPQVASLQSPAPSQPALEPFDVTPPPPHRDVVSRALDGGKQLLNRVEGTSNAVLDGTKRALGVAVDLVW